MTNGVAIVGLFNAAIGIGESARRQSSAFGAIGIATANYAVPNGDVPFTDFEPLERGSIKSSDVVVHLNPPEMLHSAYVRRLLTSQQYKIGYWAWELPVFPPAWVPALDLVEEVWVPSQFIADTLIEVTRKPVRVIPHAVPPNDIEQSEARARFQLPADRYVFSTILDTNSYPARKNPAGVINAYEDAFPASDTSRPMLLVKVQGKGNRTKLFADLLNRARASSSIRVIDETLPSDGVRALQSAADCFVSLHRSEGFGLNIAESMAAGRLVITTNFGGSTDFADPTNAVPIPYSVRLVQPDEYLMGRGQWWAEPDHDAVVGAMRWAVSHRSDADRLALSAKQHMAKNYSFEAIGRKALAALKSTTRIPRLAPSPARRVVSKGLGRNEPCPCGSGKKYKHCHGVMA